MEDLIKISQNKGKKTVSAKELYDFLGLAKSQWKRWFKRNIIENPFALESVDWIGFDIVSNGNTTSDFAISLDLAKKLSMMAKTEKGEEARNYFLKMEKVAIQSFTPTPRLEDHTRKEVQIQNSKEVNSYRYQLGGLESVIEYNRLNCKLHTGKYPSEIKAEAKKNRLPSKIRTSAKEILRNTEPVTACAMSLTDDMVKMGADIKESAKLSNTHGREIFSFMLKNGIMPGELR